MGSGASTSALTKDQANTLQVLMPPFFTTERACKHDIILAREACDIVIMGKFLSVEKLAEQSVEVSDVAPMQYFNEIFSDRMKIVYPAYRNIFADDANDASSVINHVYKIINASSFDKSLQRLVTVMVDNHLSRGIKIAEFITFCMVLLWTFDHCLVEKFTDEVRVSFCRILSRVLHMMILESCAKCKSKSSPKKPSPILHSASFSTVASD